MVTLTFWEWVSLLTLCAGLLTLAVASATYYHSRPKRSVEVSLTPDGDLMQVAFVNDQGPSVEISEVGFIYDDGSMQPRRPAVSKAKLQSVPLPFTFQSGQRRLWSFSVEHWRSEIRHGESVPVRAYCRDSTGEYYKSGALDWSIVSTLAE